MVNESLTNMKTVASFGKEKALIKLYDKKLEGPRKVSIRKGQASGFFLDFHN